MDKPNISKEKAFFISIGIVSVALLIGILVVLFMPNIKGLFHKYPNPKSYSFAENDKLIEININDEFEIRFNLPAGTKVGEGWVMLSRFNQRVLFVEEGDYEPNYQVWKFYGRQKGEVTLTFQKGDLTKEFLVKVN